MAANWTKSRTAKYAGYASIYTLVMIGVLGAINFLANRYDQSWDSTHNKQFSLSDQTIKVAKGLKSDVNMVYFGDKQSFVGAKDLLDRYSALSPKLHAEYIDPTSNPQQARSAGYRSDSPVVIKSGTRTEGAKSLTEEEVTGALIRSQKTGERNVCFVNSANERPLDTEDRSGVSLLKQLLERDNYKVRSEKLGAPAAADASKPVQIGQAPAAPANVEVPKDCTALVVAGPQLAYPTPVVNAMKAYVEGGGRALFMMDETLRLGRSEPAAENPELLKVFEDWGVTVNKDLVIDLSGLGQIFGFGPEVPVIGAYDSHPITQPLTRVATAFPLSRSLDIKSGAKTTVTKLFGTTEDSVAITEVPAGGAIDPKKGKKGPLTLAAAGTFTSTPQGRFVVIGSSTWATNNFTGTRQLGNRDVCRRAVRQRAA